MDRTEIIIAAGIGAALIWLITYVIMEGKKRKYVVTAGLIIDMALFIICKKCDLLLVGIAGGFVVGLIPFYPEKYERAVRETKGTWNFVAVSIIVCVMIFMTIGIANPEIVIDFLH